MSRILLVCLLLLTVAAFAQTPVATVSTNGDLKLNGTALPLASLMAWPVTDSDKIATGSRAAFVSFADGFRFKVAANSEVSIADVKAMRHHAVDHRRDSWKDGDDPDRKWKHPGKPKPRSPH